MVIIVSWRSCWTALCATLLVCSECGCKKDIASCYDSRCIATKCDAAKEQAKRDLECPDTDGCAVTTGGSKFHVTGCGKHASYYCEWVDAGAIGYYCKRQD